MDTVINGKALCFFEQNFAEKHNAFFAFSQEELEKEYAERPLNIGSDVYVFSTVSSTLDKAHELIERNRLKEFSSVICEEQTCGRGQLRRQWHSLRNNLYMAFVLPDVYPFNGEAAAPAFGAMTACALERLGFGVEIKWPNDLVQKQDGIYVKIGGILLEERNGCLVAGMGINLFSYPETAQLRNDFFIEAGKLKDFERPEVYGKFLKNLNNSLRPQGSESSEKQFQHIENMEENSYFPAILGFWFALVEELKLCYKTKILSCDSQNWNAVCKKYLAFLGDTVMIKDALVKNEPCSDNIYGQIIGLGQEGELLLHTETGLKCIVGGSVTK